MDTLKVSTPAQLGYHMPAEWELQEAIWITWPHPQAGTLAGCYEGILSTFIRLVEILSRSETVRINVSSTSQEKAARELLKGAYLQQVEFFHIPTNEPWCRDHGPIFVCRKQDPKIAAVNFDYNAWGKKFSYNEDAAVPKKIAEKLGIPIFDCSDFVLEGGSIDVNGNGVLLTTKNCLLHPNRNPHFSQQQIEEHLRKFLGIEEIIWLNRGIEGDDTDGHVDDITRFASKDIVLTAVEENENEANYRPLQENLDILRSVKINTGSSLTVLSLPMPLPLYNKEKRLPATYTNFLIANKVVLVPAFADANDAKALSLFKEVFPTREIIDIDCRQLICGGGALHCITQQQPAVI